MMRKERERLPDRIEAHLLIVEARFYPDLTDQLVRGAIHTIEAARHLGTLGCAGDTRSAGRYRQGCTNGAV